MGFVSYKQVVDNFEAACNAHDYVASFAHGSIDYLDASSQNIKYPYVFLRPLQSPGYSQDNKIMERSFELYGLDVPKLSTESPVDVLSRMEMTLLDITGYFVWGPPSNDQSTGYDIIVTNQIPTLEGFNDRAYGFVFNINVQTQGTYNYCNYPS